MRATQAKPGHNRPPPPFGPPNQPRSISNVNATSHSFARPASHSIAKAQRAGRTPLRVCLFGGGPDTGNHGVTALGLAVVLGVLRRVPDAHLTVFDHGRGLRIDGVTIDGRSHAVHRLGAVNSRRLYRGDNFWNIRARGRLGGMGNEVIEAIRSAHAVLDVSGGDSFTDLYGPTRFRSMTLPKLITIEQQVPLVLLPQTIGPFDNPSAREVAVRILRSAHAVWSRDAAGVGLLREMLGEAFDDARHRQGVDLAFGLSAEPPREVDRGPISGWLNVPREQRVAMNVSGLLYNQPDAARRSYGLRADYPAAVRSIASRLARKTDMRVLLTPHVHTAAGDHESDDDAAAKLVRSFDGKHRDRLFVLPRHYGALETKWVIARSAWMCGTRMHSTIAALSSGVPCAAIAYSGKTAGVFETCDMQSHVCDPRRCDTDALVDAVWRSFEQRDRARAALAKALPNVLAAAQRQMDEIVGCCQSLAMENDPTRIAA